MKCLARTQNSPKKKVISFDSVMVAIGICNNTTIVISLLLEFFTRLTFASTGPLGEHKICLFAHYFSWRLEGGSRTPESGRVSAEYLLLWEELSYWAMYSTKMWWIISGVFHTEQRSRFNSLWLHGSGRDLADHFQFKLPNPCQPKGAMHSLTQKRKWKTKKLCIQLLVIC